MQICISYAEDSVNLQKTSAQDPHECKHNVFSQLQLDLKISSRFLLCTNSKRKPATALWVLLQTKEN